MTSADLASHIDLEAWLDEGRNPSASGNRSTENRVKDRAHQELAGSERYIFIDY